MNNEQDITLPLLISNLNTIVPHHLSLIPEPCGDYLHLLLKTKQSRHTTFIATLRVRAHHFTILKTNQHWWSQAPETPEQLLHQVRILCSQMPS